MAGIRRIEPRRLKFAIQVPDVGAPELLLPVSSNTDLDPVFTTNVVKGMNTLRPNGPEFPKLGRMSDGFKSVTGRKSSAPDINQT